MGNHSDKEIHMNFENVDDIVKGYLQVFRYREDCLKSENGAALVSQIATKRLQCDYSYWKRFGYELAGPICYTYVKWISDRLDEGFSDITDIAFVARDGYLLRKIYEKLPHKVKRCSYYVYAPRALYRAYEDVSKCGEYSTYLKQLGIGSGAIAVVDTVTMRFSAQKLINASAGEKTYGFYWVVLREAMHNGRGQRFEAFQKEKYHVISSWNIMEFMMTSPEPPVKAIVKGKPVYFDENEFEPKRKEIFTELSEGVLEFVDDLCRKAEQLPIYSEKFIVDWLNSFCANPTKQDLDAFEDVFFSMKADHSDSIPLAPFSASNTFCKPKLKDKIWKFSREYPLLYNILHQGKLMLKRLSNKKQGRRKESADRNYRIE